MTTIQFLAEWALRSSILILSGALLLRAFRGKDPSIRLAAWTGILCGSLAIPALTAVLPKIPLPVMRTARLTEPRLVHGAAPAQVHEVSQLNLGASKSFDWARAAVTTYFLIAGALLLRLCAGLAMSRRLLRGSRATGHMTKGIEIRESDGVAAPVTLGITSSAIVLPADWRDWHSAKLEAALAHESSHVRRKDPAVQLLSAIHRALVWHSPLSWFLHRRIVRAAEEASDDAAVALTRDRASYAEVLLDFMRRGVRGASWQGVAMARYDLPEERIRRILDGTTLSRGVTRWSMIAILALGSPLAYVVATAHPQASASRTAAAPAAPAQAATPEKGGAIRRYMIFSDDSTSGSWDSRDPVDTESLRAKFGRNFAWFRQSGNEYVVTDEGVLAEVRRAMEPQERVNRMQSDVNSLQEKVNELQENVNAVQSGVNLRQDEVNHLQEIINGFNGADELIQKLEATLAELRARKGGTVSQAVVNQAQDKVNQMQAHVNDEQHKVNEEQHKVNEEQHRVSAEFSRRIDEILNSAVQRHLVQKLR